MIHLVQNLVMVTLKIISFVSQNRETSLAYLSGYFSFSILASKAGSKPSLVHTIAANFYVHDFYLQVPVWPPL